MWTLPSLDSVWQDIRYAARTLRRQPGFAAVAILMLATVTGLNTSLFTFVTALSLHNRHHESFARRVAVLHDVRPAS